MKSESIYCCPYCVSLVSEQVDFSLACSTCNKIYMVKNYTPIMVSGASVANRGVVPSPDMVLAIIKNLHVTDASRRDLENCFSLTFAFENPIIQTESQQFINRLRSSGLKIPSPYPADDLVPSGPPVPVRNDEAWVDLDVLTWPDRVRPGEVFAVTVVLRNTGEYAMSSSGDTPFRLSFDWSCGGVEQQRSDLLLDIEPGRQISMPVRLRAPDTAGRFAASVLPVVEHVRWMRDCAVTRDILVEPAETSRLEVTWQFTTEARDYMADHFMAVARLQGWLDARQLERPLRVLEIGGNFTPMVQYLNGDLDLHNLDIDPFGLMTRSIRSRTDGSRIRNVVADGTQLPFADGFFDAIVMFATFHHFPNPSVLLRAVRRKLQGDGFLALLCEPVGHVFAGHAPPEFLHELERGVYEQSFAPWEYRNFVEAAGFEVVTASVDNGSLKMKASPKS